MVPTRRLPPHLILALPLVLATTAFFTARSSARAEVDPPETSRPTGQEELFLPDPLHPVPEMDLGVLREEEAPDTSTPPDPYFHDGLAGDPTAPTNLATGREPARRALRDNLIPFYNARFAFNFTLAEMDALTEFLLSL